MTLALVIDASVAVKWFVREEGSASAERLLERSATLHAPRLLALEIANALAKNVRKGLISMEQSSVVLNGIGRTIGRWHEVETLLQQAFAWSLTYQHPIYDFCYLALARSLGLQLVTADDAFLRKIEDGPEARHAVSLRALA